MKTVNKLDLIYRKLIVKAQEQHNETVEISDEDYDKYYSNEYKPEPLPDSDIPIPGEEDPNHDYSQDYLTFEALEDGTFSFTVNDLYYSTNNGASWKSLAAGTETELIKAGTKVLWKKDSEMTNSYPGGSSGNRTGIGTFSSTGKFNISGNILSLAIDTFKMEVLNNTGNWPQYFKKLFKNCINLISAKNLILPNIDLSYYVPATSTTAAYYRFYNLYSYMFSGCTSLLYGPKILPATMLCSECYYCMFENCTSLLESPILPALTLSYRCYYNMFLGCSSLKKITMLATEIQSSDYINNWVQGVAPTGIFIKNSKSTFDNIGPSGIPAGWEVLDEVVPEE